jgi:DnaJ-class molecular chaperone
MDFKDYYKTMGVDRDADEKAIKSAFKKLAKQYHPDSETGSEEKFKELNEAYEVLKDKNQRSRYDYVYANMSPEAKPYASRSQSYKQEKMYSNYDSFSEFYKQKERDLRARQAAEKKNAEKASAQEQKADGNFSDFFEMFFGKQKEKQEKQEQKIPSQDGEDYEMEIELSLEDTYHGTIRKIEITGANKSTRRLEVTIPSGIRNGTKIKVANEGKPGRNGGKNGDLYLKVKIKEHDYFWLEGDDVHCEIKIEPFDAVLGCTKKIPTLDEMVELVIPPNTHNGRILRLRTKGLKNPRGESLGDQYVHVIIDISDNLSKEELTTYKYLREIKGKNL